jgi:hypothetical protein
MMKWPMPLAADNTFLPQEISRNRLRHQGGGGEDVGGDFSAFFLLGALAGYFQAIAKNFLFAPRILYEIWGCFLFLFGAKIVGFDVCFYLLRVIRVLKQQVHYRCSGHPVQSHRLDNL